MYKGRDGIHRGRVQFGRYVSFWSFHDIHLSSDLVDEYHQYANAELDDEVYEVQEEGGEEYAEEYTEE